MAAGTTRRGFTIVELLVVVTIIGMLMALLVPAVSGAREAARRALCINNQKQCGTAVLTFATTKGRMPSVRKDEDGTIVGWVYPLLPYLGRTDVYENGPDAFSSMRLPILVCPSDTTTVTVSGPMSYVVNGGIEGIARELQNGSFNKLNTPTSQRVDLSYIAKHDGTQTTIMLSENLNAQEYSDAGEEYFQAIFWPTPLDINGNSPADLVAPADANNARPSSQHPGGVVMAFCDGHVRFVSEEINSREIYRAPPNESEAYTVYDAMMTSYGMMARGRHVTGGIVLPQDGHPVSERDLEQ